MPSRLPARLSPSAAPPTTVVRLAAIAFTAALIMSLSFGATTAGATPDRQADCSLCHGSGYAATVTATPSVAYPAPSAAYTVAITISQNTGKAGYWIANSTAAGGTGTSTGIYSSAADQNIWTSNRTAPATEGVFHYKVFGEDGPKGSNGKSGFAVYSIVVDRTAPVTTDNHDDVRRTSFTLVLTPVDAVSGVATSEYSVDGGAWTSGAKVTLSLPRRHKRAGLSAGTHTVQYRSTDLAGNVESVKSCTVILGR